MYQWKPTTTTAVSQDSQDARVCVDEIVTGTVMTRRLCLAARPAALARSRRLHVDEVVTGTVVKAGLGEALVDIHFTPITCRHNTRPRRPTGLLKDRSQQIN